MFSKSISCITVRSIRSFSMWSKVPLAPPDAIFGLTAAFKNDPADVKINLGVGAYRDDSGKPFPLPSVREAEKRILERNVDHEYAPIQGNELFNKLSEEFIFGANSSVVADKRVATIQTLSGTGALRLFSECVVTAKGAGTKIYLPNPTWANHGNIFKKAGLSHSMYDYYDPSTCSFDVRRMLANLENSENNSIFLLHACAHNPTGCDPSMDEWKLISEVIKRKEHMCLFDNAYQGYSSGDAEEDAKVIRFFTEQGHHLAVCQSYSKNFGLYGHRIGSLSVVCESEDERDRLNSLFKAVARGMYSNPPIYGARIVAEILTSPDLKAMWIRDCKKMTQRIIGMRAALRKNLEDAGSKLSWKHITDQTGMFCYSGLSAEQVTRLRDEFHIYCTTDGRISIAGVTSGNVQYLAQAIHAVTCK